MAKRITCPSCDEKIPIGDDDLDAGSVACSCGRRIRLKSPKPERPAAAPPPSEPARQKPARPDKPRRRREREEEEAKPAFGPAKIVLATVAGIMLIALIGVMVFQSGGDDDDNPVAVNPKPKPKPRPKWNGPPPSPVAGGGNNNQGRQNQPEKNQQPPDGRPAGDNLTVQARDKARAAAVFVKLDYGRGGGTGSGFLIKTDGNEGLVVTNAHVVLPPIEDRGLPGVRGVVQTVFHSGQPGREFTTPAEILAVDEDRDLAVLRARGNQTLPEPLDLSQTVRLTETMTVFILGFPFGDRLSQSSRSPALTISKGVVSALRRDDAGELSRVQIDGNINPGNSGGPVIDGLGRLVGVSVSKIRGTNIGFAIPPYQVDSVLAGEVGLVSVTPELLQGGKARLKVEVTLIDPLNRLADLEASVTPEGQAGGTPVKLTRQGAKATGSVEVDSGGSDLRRFVARASYTREGTRREGPKTEPFAVGFTAEAAKRAAATRAGPSLRASVQELISGVTKPASGPGDYTVNLIMKLKGDLPDGPARLIIARIDTKGPPPSRDARGNWQRCAPEALCAEGAAVVKEGSAVGAVRLKRSTPTRLPCLIQLARENPDGSRSYSEPIAFMLDLSRAKPSENNEPAFMLEAAKHVALKLTAKAEGATVGGNGRYLVLHIPAQRKLTVIDCRTKKIAHTVPLSDNDVALAAGRDSLIVAYRGRGVVQRWGLTSGKREATENLPFREPVLAMAVGSNSDGPLLVARRGNARTPLVRAVMMDPETMKVLPFRWAISGAKYPNAAAIGTRFIRASAGGDYFTWRETVGEEPHMASVVRVRGNAASGKSVLMAGTLVHPSPDGKYYYAATGVHDKLMNRLFPRVENRNGVMILKFHNYLATPNPSYFIRLQQRTEAGLGTVHFHLAGNEKPFASLPGVAGVYDEGLRDGRVERPLPHDRRTRFLPAEGVVVSVPKGETEVHFYPFDAAAALKKSGTDYLLVASTPPAEIGRGEGFRYKPEVMSNRGGLKYRLGPAPQGMTVSPDGVVSWEVPADATGGDVEVRLTVEDAAGRECFHEFTLRVK